MLCSRHTAAASYGEVMGAAVGHWMGLVARRSAMDVYEICALTSRSSIGLPARLPAT